jgi:hypothetical protein
LKKSDELLKLLDDGDEKLKIINETPFYSTTTLEETFKTKFETIKNKKITLGNITDRINKITTLLSELDK